MDYTSFSGLFFRVAEKPHKDARFEEHGTFEVEPGGAKITATRRPGFMATLLGIILAVVALALVIAVVLLLEENGTKLLNHRKGPMFVGVMGLVAMGLGYAAGGWIADKLFSKKITLSLDGPQIAAARTTNGITLQFIYRQGKSTHLTYFKPESPEELTRLMDVLNAFTQ